jgi:chromosome segregation ATPase
MVELQWILLLVFIAASILAVAYYYVAWQRERDRRVEVEGTLAGIDLPGLQRQIAELRRGNDQIQLQLGEEKKQRDAAQFRIRELEGEKEHILYQMDGLKDQLRKENEALRAQAADLEARLLTETETRASVMSQNHELAANSLELRDAIQKLTALRDLQHGQLGELQDEVRKIGQERDRAAGEAAALKSSVDELTTERDTVHAELVKLRELIRQIGSLSGDYKHEEQR